MKVVFLEKEKPPLEESEFARQDEYISEYVNIRELGFKPGQLGRILGFLDWQRNTFPKVLEELEETEQLLEQMSSGDSAIDAKVRVAVWHAKVAVKVLVESLNRLAE
jgi:hypothetical protein